MEGKYLNDKLDSLTILRQATQGLQHLHGLDIVHREGRDREELPLAELYLNRTFLYYLKREERWN